MEAGGLSQFCHETSSASGATQLGAVWVIVHAHDSRVIEEPEVLRVDLGWVGR